MNGPKVKPNPKAAPIKPILLANFSGDETSPIYAFATGIFPLKKPAKNLAINATNKVGASPKTVNMTELPINPTIKIGLLPILSLRLPHIGAAMNCANG